MNVFIRLNIPRRNKLDRTSSNIHKKIGRFNFVNSEGRRRKLAKNPANRGVFKNLIKLQIVKKIPTTNFNF